jgi:hypothetical protein
MYFHSKNPDLGIHILESLGMKNAGKLYGHLE